MTDLVTFLALVGVGAAVLWWLDEAETWTERLTAASWGVVGLVIAGHGVWRAG